MMMKDKRGVVRQKSISFLLGCFGAKVGYEGRPADMMLGVDISVQGWDRRQGTTDNSLWARDRRVMSGASLFNTRTIN